MSGFPGLGLLRLLRPIPQASADDALSLPPEWFPGWGGTREMVPVFTVNRSTGEAPSYAPATSPWLRRSLSPRPPDRRYQPVPEFPAEAGAHRSPAHIRQIWSWCSLLRGVQPLVPRVHLPVLLAGPDPSGSAGPSRRCQGCLPPSPATPGSGCPHLRKARCDGPTVGPFTPPGYMAPRGAPGGRGTGASRRRHACGRRARSR